MRKLELKRAIYLIQFLKMIRSNDLLINIDECIVNRETLPQKSWSDKGQRAELRSIEFTKSASIITAISSDGWHFSCMNFNSINSNIFELFVTDLRKFIRINDIWNERRIIWLLYNGSTHAAAKVLIVLKKSFNVVFFLPQYSPQYAPVENFFSSFKSKLWRRCKGKTYNLHSIKGKEVLKKL